MVPHTCSFFLLILSHTFAMTMLLVGKRLSGACCQAARAVPVAKVPTRLGTRRAVLPARHASGVSQGAARPSVETGETHGKKETHTLLTGDSRYIQTNETTVYTCTTLDAPGDYGSR